jgi:hypothetical protein
MADTTVRVEWDGESIAGLRTDPGVVAYIAEVAEGFAQAERREAPKRTGAGAASIAVRDSRAQGARDVSWDADHHYMTYQNYGTKAMGLRTTDQERFAQRALAKYKKT